MLVVAGIAIGFNAALFIIILAQIIHKIRNKPLA